MLKGCLCSILFLLFLFIEVVLAQWLFGCFGLHFSFLMTFLILCVIDFLLGVLGIKK
jgi:hypothetical protein